MAGYCNIPTEFMQRCVRDGREAEGMAFIRAKAFDGQILHTERYDRRTLSKCLKAGFFMRGKSGKLFQASWKTVTEGYKSKTFMRVPRHLLEDPNITFVDIAYAMGMQHLLGIHDEGKHAPSVARKRKRTGQPHLKSSEHRNGIAHSIVCAFFGKRHKSWSSRLRRRVESLGLVSFKRRWVLLPGEVALPHPGCFKTHTGYAMESTSLAVVERPFKVTVPGWARGRLKSFDAREGCHV